MKVVIQRPNERQRLFLKDADHKYIAYGGARGGGKSWAVRTKAKLLALNYAGITQLIVRRTYEELRKNHISRLVEETRDVARYNDSRKELKFFNGSVISFGYCATDADLGRYQGAEYDVIYIDEATQLTEYQMLTFEACLRGTNPNYPHRIYYTCNPGGVGHQYIKRLFVDRNYNASERPEDYAFYQALPQDNTALMKAQPDYIKQLEKLPKKLRDAWLYGRWDVFEGQFFEDFVINPLADKVQSTGLDEETLRQRHQWCHVIPPLESIPFGWPIYRSFDWGYSRPFSCGYWTIDYDGRLYRIAEVYGWNGEPNEGVKWDADKVFSKLREYESTHPLLQGRQINGVADPAIWDVSRGVPISEMGLKYGIIFTPGDNKRIPGWMQMHYRLAFDKNGYAMMYICDNCKQFIRTIPLLQYDETKTEDLDSDGEDHIADETRYMCMARPIKPVAEVIEERPMFDPLNQYVG